MKYLYLEHGTYFFKRKIPLTKRNFSTSLRTGNLETAQFILATIMPKINILFEFCKGEDMNEAEQLDFITQVIKNYVREAWSDYNGLGRLRREAFAYITQKGKKRDGAHPKAAEKALKRIEAEIFDVDSDDAKELVNSILQRSNINFEEIKHLDQHMFRTELLKAEYELVSCDAQRSENRKVKPYFLADEVEDTSVPTQPQQEVPVQNRMEQKKEKHEVRYYEETAYALKEKYAESKRSDFSSEKSFNSFKKELDFFIDFCNQEYLYDIEKETYEAYAGVMKNLISERSHRLIYEEFSREAVADMGIDELTERVKKIYDEGRSKVSKLDLLADKSISDKMMVVSAFLEHMIEKGHLDVNRLNSEKLKKVKPKSERVRFEQKELSDMIAKTTWFNEELEENFKHRPERVFIPLIAMFQGFRGNEIAQLSTDSIIEKDGIYCYSIYPSSEDKRVKTENSKRLIPIHSKIIECGFLGLVEAQKKKGEKQIFSNLNYYSDSGYWKDFGDDFNEKLKPQFVDKDYLNNDKFQIDFHSFKHLLSSKLRSYEGIGETKIKYLSAHSLKGNLTFGRYGNSRHGENYDVKDLQKVIEKMEFGSIDFSKIINTAKKIFKT